MEFDLKDQRISVGIHVAAALAVGYLSTTLQGITYKLALGIAVLIVAGFLVQNLVGKKPRQWWLGNGVIIYLLVWFVSWMLLSNFV